MEMEAQSKKQENSGEQGDHMRKRGNSKKDFFLTVLFFSAALLLTVCFTRNSGGDGENGENIFFHLGLLSLAVMAFLFVCTSPFGAGSCVVQALAFASRGPVANFAPYWKIRTHTFCRCVRICVFVGLVMRLWLHPILSQTLWGTHRKAFERPRGISVAIFVKGTYRAVTKCGFPFLLRRQETKWYNKWKKGGLLSLWNTKE